MRTTKSKHILQRREQALDTKQQIVKLLHWKETEDFSQYADHQYTCGLAYLNYYIPTDPIGMEFLVRSLTFWNWWKNQWADRDRTFLEQGNGAWRNVKLSTLVELYLQLHDPLELAQDITPHAVVLANSYATMYQEVIDKEIIPYKAKKVK